MRTSIALSFLLVVVACRKPGDLDGDGVVDAEDCAPASANGAEVCDGIDNDCNGVVDDAPDASTWYADADADGYGASEDVLTACFQPTDFVSNADDCDDTDPAYHPGAAEAGCDGTVDFNCDGQVGIVDGDGDGASACVDCDDGDDKTFPGAVEVCNDADDDCDGFIDNNATDADDYAIDVDADGHGSDRFTVTACAPPEGYTAIADADDCDDLDDRTFPGAAELCDGIDNDCDGTIDDGAKGKGTYYEDADEDGYGDPAASLVSCVRPGGYVTNLDDCDDANKAVNPAANETCTDTTDRNCDGAVGMDDNDSDGTVACDDCDDGRADVEPGAPELCDGVDNDCDALIDETAPTWYADLDGDTHGYNRLVVVACEAPPGYVATSDDCDDFDKSAYPGASEVCDGADNNCDAALMVGESDVDGDGFLACDDDCDDAVATRSPLGLELCNGVDDDCDGFLDEASAVDAQTWYADADLDGYGVNTLTKSACAAPAGYVGNDRDCNDLSSASHPGKAEVCDTVDNDCDGDVDEASASNTTTYYADADGDGYGGIITTKACALPVGFTTQGGDCNDADSTKKPGAVEACNGLDDDCNGAVPANEVDADSDGYRACGDCNDTNAQIRPGNVEVCNGIDDNCNSSIDENAADAQVWYRDSDGDKFGTYTTTTLACSLPVGYAQAPGDCLDTDNKTYPGADPVCDAKDHDCDGHIDFDVDDDGYAANWCGGKDCADFDAALPDSKGNCNYKSCQDAYLAGAKLDGVYSIDVDGAGPTAAFDAYCDQTTNGGGWTLVANVAPVDGNNVGYNNQAFWTTNAEYGSLTNRFSNDYKSPAAYLVTGAALMIQSSGVGSAGAIIGWRRWPFLGTQTYDAMFSTGIVGVHATDLCETASSDAVSVGTTNSFDDIIRQGTCLYADVNPSGSGEADLIRLTTISGNSTDNNMSGFASCIDCGTNWQGATYPYMGMDRAACNGSICAYHLVCKQASSHDCLGAYCAGSYAVTTGTCSSTWNSRFYVR